ncbi:helix-turn-helix domain-containing protein [Pseudomonadota bacterium]|nr:helix-turn-helix domain-containing protein [Pseudomonadota bacterium]
MTNIQIDNLTAKLEILEARIEELTGVRKQPQAAAMTTKQAAEYCGWTDNSFRQMRLKGVGPICFKIFGNAIRYKKSDLDGWIDKARNKGAEEYKQRQEAIEANAK